MSVEDKPFVDLPEALVEEMLKNSFELSDKLSTNFNNIRGQQSRFREILESKNMVEKDTSLITTKTYPTACGVDGSFTLERLLSTDLVATAAVAVEGITPPSEIRHWPKPRHFCYVDSINHSDATSLVLRALMMCLEIKLANRAPHDVIMIDGSLTTPLIYINQALARIEDVSVHLSAEFMNIIERSLELYLNILKSARSDKIFVGIPKYTTKKEISENIFGLIEYEDRGLLSFLLEPGEYIVPLEIQKPKSPWHINRAPIEVQNTLSEIYTSLNDLKTTYYRPSAYLPALRMEVSNSVASNQNRLAILFEAIGIQCGAPAIFEPFPLYMADRMVKHLNSALPAIRKAATQEIAINWDENYSKLYFAMHDYRSEWGK
jgi:hypothetical protein